MPVVLIEHWIFSQVKQAENVDVNFNILKYQRIGQDAYLLTYPQNMQSKHENRFIRQDYKDLFHRNVP